MQYTHVLVLGLLTSLGSSLKLTVSSTGGNQTSPLQYGIMFEDINRSGDGGIYAELINNRAFQGNPVFPSTITPWTPIGDCKLSLQTASPVTPALPTHLNVYANSAKGYKVGIRNPGYWGIDVKPQKYQGSFFTRGPYNGTFTASLESALTNQVWASTDFQVKSLGHGWTKHYFEIDSTASAPYPNNTFSLTWQDGTSLDINMISLFPPTYKNR
jgi:alpha-L-arabinofuranosidase